MEDIYETGGPNNQEDATFVAKGENGQVGLMNSDRLWVRNVISVMDLIQARL